MGTFISKTWTNSKDKKVGSLLRNDGTTDGMDLETVTKAHIQALLLLHKVIDIEEGLQKFTRTTFCNTDIDYDIIISNPSKYNYFRNRRLKKEKRALIMGVISYQNLASRVESYVYTLLDGRNSMRDFYHLQPSHRRKIVELRNEAAHSYQCPCDIGCEDFDSRKFWDRLTRLIPEIRGQLENLEGRLYRTKLVMEGQKATMPPVELPEKEIIDFDAEASTLGQESVYIKTQIMNWGLDAVDFEIGMPDAEQGSLDLDVEMLEKPEDEVTDLEAQTTNPCPTPPPPSSWLRIPIWANLKDRFNRYEISRLKREGVLQKEFEAMESRQRAIWD